MAAVNAPAGLPLWSDHVRFVRRHQVAISALVCLGALAGLVWSLGQETSYSATASVVLVPVPMYVTASTTEIAPPEVSIDTDVQLLHSPRVLTAIADVIGTDPDQVGEHLSVTASPNSHVLHITVSARSPRAAADAADAAVVALVNVRRDALGALQLDQLAQLRLLISRQQEMLRDDRVVAAYDDVSAHVLQLNAGLQELQDARRRPADAVDPAEPPRHTDRANTEVPVTSGAMTGLLCGCLLGATRDRRGRSSRPPLGAPIAPSPPGQPPAGSNRHKDYRYVA